MANSSLTKKTKEEKNKVVVTPETSIASSIAPTTQAVAQNIAEPKKTTLNGVDDTITNKINSEYQKPNEVTQLDTQRQSAATTLEGLVNKDQIITQDVYNGINSQFVKPSSVTQADAYLNQQLKTIQSGKTSWTDGVQGIMDKIANREKFTYDVDTDPLFQQALASAMNSGKQAMQDTIGQASALTGGYGSTYATSVGNQAYNSFIEDAYDNLPQYYEMAMQKYQMEGDELYRQLDMYNMADDKEYNRNIAAYDATFNMRNRQYDESYNKFRDDKSDWFAKADLQLQEHNQQVSDATNYYNVTADMSDTMYERSYNEWADSVNKAMQYAQLLNTDYWNKMDYDQTEDHFNRNLEFQGSENQKDRDLTVSENALDREHQSSENALDREHQSSENALNREHQSSENALDREHQSSENALNREHDSSESAKQREWQSGENQKDRDFTATENAKNRSSSSSKTGGSYSGGGGGGKTPTQTMKETAVNLYNSGQLDELASNLDYWISEGYDVSSIEGYIGVNGNDYGGEPWAKDFSYLDSFKIYNDGDKSKKDTYVSTYKGYEEYLTYDQLSALIYDQNKDGGVPYDKRKALINKYQGQSKK